jgi:hypothetical protein
MRRLFLLRGRGALAAVLIALGATGGLSSLPATQAGATESPSAVSIACGAAPCPTVSATPTTNLGTDQWSYVSVSGFPVDDTVNVAYCSNAPGTGLGDEPCDLSSSSTVVVLADGTAETSIQLPEVDSSGTPLAGDNGTDFFCTNNDPCSIDATDPSLTGSSTKSDANTAVVPVSFAVAAAACPDATTVATASEYGLVQELLSASAPAACAGSTPATAFNTELDSVPAAQSLASGNAQIAFVDDPGDAAVQAALGPDVAFIPVALTANVLGFKATENFSNNGNTSLYPDNSFDLTPTMVAGFVSNLAAYQQQAQPPPDPVPCTSGRSGSVCSLITELNPAQPGFSRASAYGALVRAGTSGSTYSLEQWLCAAGDAPVPLPGGSSVTESTTPGSTLAQGFAASSTTAACPALDQFPALSTSGGNWFSEVSPSQQALKLEQGIAGQTTPSAFFAPMVWTEALYNGLDMASLQNASGALVSPSAASVDAALADATTNANGTLTYDDTDGSDAAAYPMPDVIYAVVSTAQVPAATAGAEQSVLRGLLAASSPTSSTALPGGYLPLPQSLYSQGVSAVGSDIHAAPATTTTATTAGTTSTTTPATVASGGNGTAAGGISGTIAAAESVDRSLATLPGPLGLLGALDLDSLQLSAAHPGATTAPAAAGAKSGTSADAALLIPRPLAMELLTHNTAWLVPWFERFLIAAVLLGPVLLIWLRIRRRAKGRSPEGEGGEVPPDGDLSGAAPAEELAVVGS